MGTGQGGPLVRAVLPEARADDDAPSWTPPPVVLTRTAQGWAVVSPRGAEPVADLVEGMTLADLITVEFGASLEPDRATRRSARGPAGPPETVEGAVDSRVAALERTVAQLEHALAARVATERAIGVLAERHGTSPRAAFETLRREARSQGRAVHELAHEVLAELPEADGAAAADPPAVNGAPSLTAVTTLTPATPRPAGPSPRFDSAAVADGRP